MNILIRNTLRGVRKRLFQYFGIAILLIIAIASITSLYSNTQRVTSAFYEVAQNSGEYDYRIAPKSIYAFKNINASTNEIKDEISNQFFWVKSETDKKTINDQIESLTPNDIQNNLLPSKVSQPLNKDLETYLLNWGVDYKTILINRILNNQIKNDPATSSYNFIKSYFKYFNYNNKSEEKFFNFEDAFYLNPLPPDFKPNPDKNADAFDFCPVRTSFNKMWITQGRQPKIGSDDEIVINPKFAAENNLQLNDNFNYLPNESLKIVGFGYTYWGATGESTIENLNPTPNNTSQIFTTREWMNQYLKNNAREISNVRNQILLKVNNNDIFFANKLEAIYNKTFNFDYGTLINFDSNDARGGALKKTFSMQTIIFSSISLIVLFVAIFIVLFYVKKEINIQKKQIGLLKATGYSNVKISIGFIVLIFVITLTSAIAGFALGLPLQLLFNSLGKIEYFLPIHYLYISVLTMVVSIVVVPMIFVFASFAQSLFSLSTNPLLLIYDKPSNSSSKWVAIFKRPFNHWSFKQRLAISFALKSFGKLSLIFFIFIFVSFLLLFQSVATDIFENKIQSLYSYYQKDVFSKTATVSMYKNISPQGKVQIYNWKEVNDLDLNKQIKADDFVISNEAKLNKLKVLLVSDLKNYFITSEEINLLYKSTQPDSQPPGQPDGKTYQYMWPNGPVGGITEEEAEKMAAQLTTFLKDLVSYINVDPEIDKIPGISIGQNIFNKNILPGLQFFGNAPPSWIGHNQGPLGAKVISVTSVYNDPSRNINWKDWFNFIEEKRRDIDSIFNASHQLATQSVTYIDNFGIKQTVDDCYVVPAVISKTLATLNSYKYGDRILNLYNIDGNFIPIIFDIKGVIVSNLDTPTIYSNIDDIRMAINYVDASNEPIKDSFNVEYSKEKSVLPVNFINIAQPDNNYQFLTLKDSYILITKAPMIFDLIKKTLENVFNSLKSIINITKYLIIFALIFILIIIINIILDSNIMIIAMMKSLGYRINEINLLIIGSYIVALILAFILGSIFSYIVWHAIVFLVGRLASTVFFVPINPLTIFVTFAIISGVMTVGYLVGLYLIKYRSVTTLLQGE